MNRLNTLIYLKKTKINGAGEAPIYLRITLNGQRSEWSISRKIDPKNWDSNNQRMKGRSEKARLLNNYIDELENELNRHYNIALQDKKTISVEELKDLINGNGKKKQFLIPVFEEYNKLLEREKGKKYAAKTVARYVHALGHIKSFLSKEYGKADYELLKLDIKFMKRFDIYLQTESNYHHNTVTKYLKILKTVINSAISFGYLDRNPFLGYSTSYKESNRQYLTIEEINAIEEKQFGNKKLERVRDVFIFICFTGISYSDLAKLTPNNISKGIDGKSWLTFERVKTGIRTSLPLLPKAQSIIEKYKNDPICSTKGKLLPVISNQKMNNYLEEVAKACNINKPVTCHIGRHSFAVSVTLTNGVPIETVSKMLSHSSLKTTQYYAKVVDTKISNDMEKLEQKLKTG